MNACNSWGSEAAAGDSPRVSHWVAGTQPLQPSLLSPRVHVGWGLESVVGVGAEPDTAGWDPSPRLDCAARHLPQEAAVKELGHTEQTGIWPTLPGVAQESNLREDVHPPPPASCRTGDRVKGLSLCTHAQSSPGPCHLNS